MMQRGRKLLLYLVLPLVLIICFKGCIYRAVVSYKSLRSSPVHYSITNDSLKAYIAHRLEKDAPATAHDAVELSLSITSHFLSFHSTRTANDPNVSCITGRAHCVGYSAFFNSVLTFIAQKQNIDITSEHVQGKLYFLGFDLHRLSSSPFWASHDYNRIRDNSTGDILYTDPALYDYTGIAYISPSE